MDNNTSYTKQELLDIVKNNGFLNVILRTTWSCLDAWGNAELKMKDKIIYIVKYLQFDLFEKLLWDISIDPALDSF